MVTTIKIKKETKGKLDTIKENRNISYNDIIENLIQQTGGEYIDDVVEITRDDIAFVLKYWEYDNMSSLKELPVSFKDLKEADEGTVFEAYSNPDVEDYVNSTSEVIFKRGCDVVLLNTDYNFKNGVENGRNVQIVHINVF